MNYGKQINLMRAKMAAIRGNINAAVQFLLNAGVVFAKAVRYALIVAREAQVRA